VIFLCNRCLVAADVLVDHPDAARLVDANDVHTCPWCGEGSMRCHPVLSAAVRERAENYTVVTVSTEDFYRAVRLGTLPGEYGAPIETVTNLFRFGRIKAIEMKGAGQPERTIIECIHFVMPDGIGMSLHLGPSTHGATAYKITEKPNGRRSHDGGPGPDRTQDGPDPAPPAGGGAADDAAADELPSV